MALSGKQIWISRILQVAAAIIMLQTLFFKFTGAEESIKIFSTLGAEPWGRFGSGVIELIAAALIIAPNTVAYGAVLTAGTMAGAIFSHLTVLGIDLGAAGVHDGGALFALAVVTFLCAATLIYMHRDKLPIIGNK